MLPEPSLSFTLPSLHDGTTLDCRLYHPRDLAGAGAGASPPRPWRKRAVVVAHPYAPLGGSYDDPVVDVVAGTLLRLGFVAATFNFRGAGKSSGRTSWTSRAERSDYMSVAGFLAHYVHHLDPSDGPGPPTFEPAPPPTSGIPVPALHVETEPAPSTPPAPTSRPAGADILLLLAGYSYGAMITTQLPPFDAMLAPFSHPQPGSPAAEIRLRARRLAAQQSLVLARERAAARAALGERPRTRTKQKRRQQLEGPGHEAAAAADGAGGSPPRSPGRSIGMTRVGGDEARRASKSYDSARGRSFSLDEAEDRIRRGVGGLLGHGRKGKGGGTLSEGDGEDETARAAEAAAEARAEERDTLGGVPDDLTRAKVAYLLVSPPIGWATSLMTLSLPSPFGRWPAPQHPQPPPGEDGVSSPPQPRQQHGHNSHHGHGHHHQQQQQHHHHHHHHHSSGSGGGHDRQLAEQKLTTHPTLAIYGDADVFAAARRLRSWAGRLQGVPGSRFRAVEVSTAGHFYIEEGTMARLRDAAGAYGEELAGGE